jgi:hypothetical protein
MRTLGLLAVVGSTLGAQELRVGGILARAGARTSGFIEVPAGIDSGTRIPITLIRGTQPGPVLALIAGTHGSETAPIVALQRLRAEVEPARLHGTVILVHVANMPSFIHRTIYRGPWDQKNLNRVYPGKPNGTVSERIAHIITTEIIDQSDYLVDMHAGDGNESLRPYTYWNKLGLDPRVDSISRELALAWGHDHIIVDTTRPRDAAASVYTQNTAQLRGKPSLTTETGALGQPAEDMVALNVRGAMRLMRYLRMIPGERRMVEHPVWIVRAEVLTSPETGTWHAAVEPGQIVPKGALLGRLTNFFGEPIAEIRSPYAGVVMYVIGTPAMTKGEPVAMVGEPLAARKAR